MQVTSLQILLSYSYTQKKRVKGKSGEKKKKADKCLPPITQLICPLISPNLRSAFLYFFKHFFCPPPYCTHLDGRGQLPPGGMHLCRKRFIHR